MPFWLSRKFARGRLVNLNSVHAARISPAARQALIDCDVKPAKPEEVADWVEGFLKAGGHASAITDHDMWDDFFVAQKSAHIPALFGAALLTILVPREITVTTDSGNNHNYIYWMDGFRKSSSYLSVSKDVARILSRRGYTEKDLLQGLVATRKKKPPAPSPVPPPAAPPPESSSPAPAFRENTNDTTALKEKVTVYKPLKFKQRANTPT